MGSPYREGPRLLLCPRCAEMLDRAFEGVWPCPRCEGLWIAPATLDAAFGDPRWPPGHAMWWRNSIECPECAVEGKATVMTARMSRDVIVDQCADHGVWLDRGELGRLMGTGDDELGALRARLAASAPDLGELVEQREKWRADLESRRRAVVEYKQMLDEKYRQHVAIAEAERGRLAAESAARAAAATAPEASPLPPHASTAPPSAGERDTARPPSADERDTARPPSTGERDTARPAAQPTEDARILRAQASADVARLQDRVGLLSDHIRRLEGELAVSRQRAAVVQQELDAARAKLRALDDQRAGSA